MKKLNLLFIFLIIFLLSSCFKTDTDLSSDTILSGNLIELVDSYQEKITSIIENDEESNRLTSANQNNVYFDEEDPNYISRDAFLQVYNVQRDNHQDVKLDTHLMIYKDLLDHVRMELEALNIESLEAEIYVNFRDLLQLEAFVTVTADQSLLVRLTINVQEEIHYYGIKLGYENEDFYLRELIMGLEPGRFEYFEFLENHQIINIRYTNYSYWYQYINQNDYTYYEISRFDDAFSLSWLNPETNIRTTISRHPVYGDSNQLMFFNEKGPYCILSENLSDGSTTVAWQLLEATGWDGAYHEDRTSNPLNGVYKNGQKIFSDAHVIIDLNDNFAFVTVSYSFMKSELSNDILNLSAYGLTFNYPKINLELIDNTLMHVLEESSHLSIYRGIDFLHDDLSQILYAAIDDEIKPSK